MDPASIGQLADVAPPEPLIRVVNEVLRRRDYVTVGPFLAYATPNLIAAMERGVRDDEGLILATAYAFSAESISAILRQLLNGPAQRMPRMLRSVLAGSPDLQLAGLSVFARCEPEVIRAIGDILFGVGSPPAVDHLLRTAVRLGAVPELLILAGNLSRQALGKMAASPIFDDYDTMTAIVAALDGNTEINCWRGLFTLAARTGTDVQRRTARLLAALPDPMVIDLPTRATEADVWPMLLQLIAVADPTAQGRFGAAWATLSAERRAGLQWHIHEHHLDARLATITDAAPTMSVEEVFYKRRKRRRHLGTAEANPADTWNPW
jgi:hypothetical protein